MAFQTKIWRSTSTFNTQCKIPKSIACKLTYLLKSWYIPGIYYLLLFFSFLLFFSIYLKKTSTWFYFLCIWYKTIAATIWLIDYCLTLAAILVGERDCRSQIRKRTIQWLFHQSLVLIELLVPDKMVFMWISHRVLC